MKKRNIDFLFVNTSSLTSYPDTVSPEAITNYYEENKADYKQEEMRSLDTVFFELTPTSADTAEVIERAQLLVQKARSGEDFSELANGYSEDQGNTDYSGNKRGGDLGFFGKGAMVQEFEDTAFNMKPGEISEPFLTRFGCHIVCVDSLVYNENGKDIDQVKARHILLLIEPSLDTQETVENRAKAFFESVNSGADFDMQAEMENLQILKNSFFLLRNHRKSYPLEATRNCL